MKGPNAQGSCLAANEFGGLAKRIDFGKQTSSSCHVTLDDIDEFRAFCSSTTQRAGYEIFAQFLERFESIA